MTPRRFNFAIDDLPPKPKDLEWVDFGDENNHVLHNPSIRMLRPKVGDIAPLRGPKRRVIEIKVYANGIWCITQPA